MDAWEADEQRFRQLLREADEEILRGCQIGVAKGCDAGLREALASRKYKDITGKLTRSAYKKYVNTTRGAKGSFGFTARHASFVNDGTKPHVIEPRRKKLLRFEGGGEVLFARRVNHPGTDKDGFMERGEAAAEKALTAEIEASLERAAKLIGR